MPAPGLAGLTPGAAGGSLVLNSTGRAGLYSRSRGHGADDMLLTNAGLWIASDKLRREHLVRRRLGLRRNLLPALWLNPARQ